MPGAALFAGGQVLQATAYILDVQFTPRDPAIYQTLAPLGSGTRQRFTAPEQQGALS